MRRALDLAWGLWELARLAWITRCRFRGLYWRWRRETALGVGPPKGGWAVVKAAARYGAWVHRMRRGRC